MVDDPLYDRKFFGYGSHGLAGAIGYEPIGWVTGRLASLALVLQGTSSAFTNQLALHLREAAEQSHHPMFFNAKMALAGLSRWSFRSYWLSSGRCCSG